MVYPDTFVGYGSGSADTWETPVVHEFKPKPFGDYDIDIKIHACGVCGSDLHSVTGGWGNKHWPLIPGHEIIGEAVKVGPKVTSIKVGDRVGVGAQILSCLECDDCKNDNEIYCPTLTDTYGAVYPDGTFAQGGYASHIRAHEHFTLPIPESLETNNAAPLLCGGITAFSPLVRGGVSPGKKVGIIGIGGIGHLGLLLAKALGAEVWAISHSERKKADALAMGANGFLATKEPGWNKEHLRSFDFILSTASSLEGFKIGDYLQLLKTHCKFVNIGLPEDEGWKIHPFDLLKNGCFVGSSHLGSRSEILQMLQLAADKNIKLWVEELPMTPQNVGKALRNVKEGKPRYRQTLVNFEAAFGK